MINPDWILWLVKVLRMLFEKIPSPNVHFLCSNVRTILGLIIYCCFPPRMSDPTPNYGGATHRLQVSTIQTDYNIFGKIIWPTICIAYKNGTIHIAYTSSPFRSTTVLLMAGEVQIRLKGGMWTLNFRSGKHLPSSRYFLFFFKFCFLPFCLP